MEIDRRNFVLGAGAAFASYLSEPARANLADHDALLASACRFSHGGYGAVLIDPGGNLIKAIDLPMRGHAVALCAHQRRAVAFARRPGNLAVAFDIEGHDDPVVLVAPKGRHFYGHGTFSTDGRLLYASENDFDAGTGRIGIYDATNGFARLGEYNSYGVGPHQITLMPDGRTLAICNGGIQTHPSSGRVKLNLRTMKPSLAFLDLRDGSLIERHELPKTLHQLSVRHLAVTPRSEIVIGCQFEGDPAVTPPLFAKAAIGQPMQFYDTPKPTLTAFRNYVGSVAVSCDGRRFGVTSSRGGHFAIFDIQSGEVVMQQALTGAQGIAWSGRLPFACSEDGALVGPERRSDFAFGFDNHLTASPLRC